jgi:hypothetical protein
MNRILKNTLLFFVLISLFSCKEDESTTTYIVPFSEQAPIDDAALREFLSTNYYNEEEFSNATSIPDFKFDIKFSEEPTVTGYDSNSDGVVDGSDVDDTTVFNRQSLLDLVETKIISIDDVEHNLYVLRVVNGEGADQPKFCDSTFLEYKGMNLNKEIFDNKLNPTWLDLAGTVRGFSESVSEFNTALGGPLDNGDGTFTYDKYGVGAVFMPSALGYYASPPSAIGLYSPLIFTLKVLRAVVGTDHDNDGVPSYLEDLNGDHFLSNDDTDLDRLANYTDANDDNDPVLTVDEDIDGDGDPTNDDTDGDGIPNYLDSDS